MSVNSDVFKTVKKKKIARAPLEEVTNRDGHWMREFTSRLEAWPIVEPWVSDCDFHMIAAKGKRRLYLKEMGPFARLIVDIKQWETQVTVSAWIEVNFWGRLISLFTLPSEMFPYPGGIHGVRIRRSACRQLNDLLSRFRQAPILGSDRFHITDLDITTLLLAGGMILPFLFFGAAALAKFELVPGLSNALLISVAKYWSTFASVGATLVVVHHLAIAKRMEAMAIRAASAGVSFVVYTVLMVILLTRTSTEMLEAKLTYNCLTNYKENKCQEAIADLPVASRQQLTLRLKNLGKHLSK